MGILKKIAGFLGFANHDDHEVKENNDDDDGDNNNSVNRAPQNQAHFRDSGLPRKGFSVPVQVSVDRPIPGPIIIPCRSGDGGVQGLKWHAKRLKMDEDGDVADEFLDEIFPDMSVSSENRTVSRFEVKSRTRPAKVKHQVLSRDGRIQQRVDYQGSSMWV